MCVAEDWNIQNPESFNGVRSLGINWTDRSQFLYNSNIDGVMIPYLVVRLEAAHPSPMQILFTMMLVVAMTEAVLVSLMQ